MIHFDVVVAADRRNGIGKDGRLPWTLPGDIAHFRTLTSTSPSPVLRNAVILGRKTWDSLPTKPLLDRLNVVVSRNAALELPRGTSRASSLADALAQLQAPALQGRVGRVFVIGGSTIYAAALAHPACRQVVLTRVLADFECDAHFPKLSAYERRSCSELREDNGVSYRIEIHEPLPRPANG